ncbi:unnamed protein product [Brassica rapa]|uniref:Uncharacterized protein n=1 Tax=Brassica campestris TaxID=3711 RepID=A0A8D9I6P7_BRACM|nr:unnamed protein product [Brassica rapa]
MGLISHELFESLEKSCGGNYMDVHPSNAKCVKDLQAYKNCISEIYTEQILLPNCPVDYVPQKLQFLPNIKNGRRRELKEFSGYDTPSLPPPSCFTYGQFLASFWANDEIVRRALGVKKELGKWTRCNFQNIPYTYDIDSPIPYHVNNSRKGFRSLISRILFIHFLNSGDHDMSIPFTATEEWIKGLNYSIVDDWRPWMMSSYQVGGYTRTYANKMTFATIKALFLNPISFSLSSPKPLQEEDTPLSIIQTNAHLCSKNGLMENLSEVSHSFLSQKLLVNCQITKLIFMFHLNCSKNISFIIMSL